MIMLEKGLFTIPRPANIPGFQSIRDIIYSTSGTPIRREIHPSLAWCQARTSFYLPNIRKLRLNRLETMTKSISSWPVQQPCASTLTHLEIRETALADEALGDILKVCPNLEYLKYKYFVNDDRDDAYFHGTKTTQALENVCKTLETLVLDVDIRATSAALLYFNDRGVCDGTVNLSNFPKLQDVEAPIAALLGMVPELKGLPDIHGLSDVLPPSLRKLAITDMLDEVGIFSWTAGSICQSIVDYVKTKGIHTPELQEIRVLNRLIWWPKKDVERLVENCKVSGVVFSNSSEVILRKGALTRPPPPPPPSNIENDPDMVLVYM